MSEPFLAEVRMMGFNFAPRGWAFCSGQLLPIDQNQSLYSLLGTTYGGDGRTSFALPDLRGRVPIHFNTTYEQGTKEGEENHTLSVAEMPAHDHTLRGSQADVTTPNPTGALLGENAGNLYHAPGATGAMADDSIATTGAGQGHENMMPFLVVNFCIALQGAFPSRS